MSKKKTYTFKGVERVPTGSVTASGKPKTTKANKRSYARAIGGGGRPARRTSR